MDTATVLFWNRPTRFVRAIRRPLGRSYQIQFSFIKMLQSKPSDCLMLHRLPGRLDAAQTAALLGFQPHDIPVLTGLGLLKPLGRPAPNSTRYFAATYIDGLRENTEWLDKATRAIGRHWQEKNLTVRTHRDSSPQVE
jgi:hypothetical protein